MEVEEILSFLQDPTNTIDSVLRFAQDNEFHPGIVSAIIGRSDCPIIIACELIDRSGFDFSVIAAVISSRAFKYLPPNTKVVKNDGEDELGEMYKLVDVAEYLQVA
jgi:hypothetical protein